GGAGSRGSCGGDEQAASIPRISASPPRLQAPPMLIILLEALGALLIFVFIIWWTMFSGRNKGERRDE
ncbi:MAG: hypothetical protein ACK44A_10870, partial [Roseateles sp.]